MNISRRCWGSIDAFPFDITASSTGVLIWLEAWATVVLTIATLVYATVTVFMFIESRNERRFRHEVRIAFEGVSLEPPVAKYGKQGVADLCFGVKIQNFGIVLARYKVVRQRYVVEGVEANPQDVVNDGAYLMAGASTTYYSPPLRAVKIPKKPFVGHIEIDIEFWNPENKSPQVNTLSSQFLMQMYPVWEDDRLAGIDARWMTKQI